MDTWHHLSRLWTKYLIPFKLKLITIQFISHKHLHELRIQTKGREEVVTYNLKIGKKLP